jgi:hypothetical protein
MSSRKFANYLLAPRERRIVCHHHHHVGGAGPQNRIVTFHLLTAGSFLPQFRQGTLNSIDVECLRNLDLFW